MTWVRGCEPLLKCRLVFLGIYRVVRDYLVKLGKFINYCEQLLFSTVLAGDTLHIKRVGLPLRLDFRYIGMIFNKPTVRRFVQRIHLIARKYSLTLCRNTHNTMSCSTRRNSRLSPPIKQRSLKL